MLNKSLPLFLCKPRSIQWLIEKENEEKIWKRLGDDLEIQNKISRGKRKYFLSSTSRKKNKLEGEEKKLKHSSQELKKEGEVILPKECIKGFVCSPCDCKFIGRLTACFF